MAKKKTKSVDWQDVSQAREVTAGLLREIMADARVQHKDDSITTAGELGGLVLGVPLPSFALEYVLQNNVWPLERVVQVVGIHGTCKSGFSAEVMRWFRQSCGGVGTVFEVEDKWSPDWAPSIIGWDDPHALGFMPAKSVNDWQAKLLWTIDRLKRKMTGTKTDPGTGRRWPWLGIVDSVTGKATEETQAAIDSKGFAGRARPEEARMITGFLRTLPERLRGWPFSVLAINHLKPDRDPVTGAIIRNKSGGRGLDFMETWELELTHAPQKKIRESHRDGLRLFLSCQKNSLGVTSRKTPIDVYWWEEELPDASGDVQWRQRTVWDWYGASIQLLLKLPDLEPEKAGRLKEVLTITPVSAVRRKSADDPTQPRRVVCKALGITADSPVSFEEAGKILQETPSVLTELRRIFGIKVRAVFQPGVDYRRQRLAEKSRLAQGLKVADEGDTTVEEIPDEEMTDASEA